MEANHLEFFKARAENFDDYYNLKCEKNNIFWSGFSEKPDEVKLKEWYLKQLKNTDRIFYLIYINESQENIAGYLYMDIEGDKKQLADIGYGVSEKYSGRGIGTGIINFAIDHIKKELPKVKEITAWVAYDNVPSIKVFLKNNFHKTVEQQKRFFKSLNKEVLFEKYSYYINRGNVKS